MRISVCWDEELWQNTLLFSPFQSVFKKKKKNRSLKSHWNTYIVRIIVRQPQVCNFVFRFFYFCLCSCFLEGDYVQPTLASQWDSFCMVASPDQLANIYKSWHTPLGGILLSQGWLLAMQRLSMLIGGTFHGNRDNVPF